MKKLLILLLLPTSLLAQPSDLSASDKKIVDSIVQRTKQIRQSKSHRMMVSFSEGDVNGVTPFIEYLINKLNYYSKSGEVEIKATAKGYATTLYHASNGYSSNPLSVQLQFNCKPKSTQLQGAVISGPLSLLADIYLLYFEGTVSPDRPANGGLDKTYTITDEVRLYNNKIVIQPHNNYLSGK